MQFELSLYLDDRTVSRDVVATVRQAGPSLGFTVGSAEEADAIGLSAIDVIVSIVVAFGTSVTANVVSDRITQLLENVKKKHPEVVSTAAQPAAAEGTDASKVSVTEG